MAEVARHDGRDGTYWLEIRGEVYDITDFIRRHPGGDILKLGAGRHATVLFESYHPGPSHERALRVLARKATHVGTLCPQEQEFYGDPAFFEDVRARVDALLTERGLHYHSRAWAILAEAIALPLLFTLAWVFRVWWSESLLIAYGAAVAGGVLLARMGFVMHSGNHAALSRKPGPNRYAGMLMDFIGGSSLVWQAEHQYSHHGRPNVLGKDNDCQIGTPLLRFHPSLPHRWIHRIQVPGLAIGMSIGLIKWIITDLQYALRRRVTHVAFHLNRPQWARLIGFKSLWMVMHLVIPIIVAGPLHALLSAFVMLAVGAYYMEGIFIVNHLQRDLVPQRDVHWAVQQIQGTANWSSGSHLANFISGSLNHQVEHHLFPSMSVYLYPTIAPVVRKACEDHGLGYRDYPGFAAALAGTAGYLHELGRPSPSQRDQGGPPTDERPDDAPLTSRAA